MSRSASGGLVTIDGPSAIGKTTTAHHVTETLRSRGVDAIVTSTPSDSAIGHLARSMTFELSAHALSCLVAADRYHHHTQVVVPALDVGKIVICDRHVPSAFVLDRADGVVTEYLTNLYSALPVPDLAIVLVGDPSITTSRARERNVSYSRFHSLEARDHRREHARFRDAVGLLRKVNYPVHCIDVDRRSKTAIAGEVIEAMRGSVGGLL